MRKDKLSKSLIFRNIRYTRTTSVAEGAECCDYRLVYDKNKE